MLASLFGNPGSNFASVVEKYTAIDDPQVIPHVANMLAAIEKTKSPEDIVHLSNLVKQTEPRPHLKSQHRQEAFLPSIPNPPKSDKEYQFKKFTL
jgi:hypothetical protein